MNSFVNILSTFLTAQFKYASELQAFWMAIQGAVAVRKGPNKDKSMAWFHSFMLSVLSGYGGACFTNVWMGKPTSMLSNDLNFAMCILAYALVNWMPFGFRICTSLPVVLVTTVFAQMFRSNGVTKFTWIAYDAFKDNPSAYYPTPVFGPILFATFLGNMSGFFLKGFHDYLRYGMPWPFQNGFFCASFYHFFVHDETGFIGVALRKMVYAMPWQTFGLTDKDFATVFVGVFMQAMGILQLTYFLGPGFSPFNRLWNLFDHYVLRSSIEVTVAVDTTSGAVNAIATKKRKRKRKNKHSKGKTTTTNGPVTTYNQQTTTEINGTTNHQQKKQQ